jgi:integrase
MSLSDLVDDFMSEPRQHAVSSKTRHQRNSALDILSRALGAETATNAVSRRDARALRDALLARPRARPATVNAKLSLYAALFRHAVREHGLAANMFEGLSVPDPVRPEDKRRSFTKAELEKVVAHPPEGSLRWVLLLGLMNGLRRAEATGLRPQDVRREGGVVVIDVVSHEARGLKTAASARTVPAHPLIADALLDFMRGEPWTDLPDGTRTKVAGQRLVRYLRAVVSKDPKLVGHSARHTFRDRMREGGVGRDAALQLGGWTSGAVADSYGSGMSPKALLGELRKVKYEVDLSRLVPSPVKRRRA